MTLTLKIDLINFCRTFRPVMVHFSTRYGYERLSDSEDIFWTIPATDKQAHRQRNT